MITIGARDLVAAKLEMPQRTPEEQAKTAETFRKIRKLRKEMNLSGLDWKAMRDEGCR